MNPAWPRGSLFAVNRELPVTEASMPDRLTCSRNNEEIHKLTLLRNGECRNDRAYLEMFLLLVVVTPGTCALRGRAPESRTFRARDANGREASEPSPHIGLRGHRTRRGQRDCRTPQKWSRSNCNAAHRARCASRRGKDWFTLR